MASWREGVDPNTQDDLDTLLDASLTTAEETLRAGRPLLPFVVTVDDDGEVEVVMSTDPGSTAVEGLTRMLLEIRADLAGAALVYDVTLDGSDAVQVALEHRDPAPPALIAALPYTGSGAEFTASQPRVALGSRRIWS